MRSLALHSVSSQSASLPKHIAIIMDGNGRWAEARRRPRSFGHHAGVQAVRAVIEACMQKGIDTLTLFAFSSENWSRPAGEVSALMELFLRALDRELNTLHENGARLRFIGDLSAFPEELSTRMQKAQTLTAQNQKINVNIAVNYGGRWDITQACQKIAQAVVDGDLRSDAITPETVAQYLSLAELPDPDLFIRTGGETRVSNFLLWQLAYCELHFSDVLWPDFGPTNLQTALDEFSRRERRFGKTSAQVQS